MHLHEYVTFKCKNDVTPSNATVDVILQLQQRGPSARFPHAFKNVNISFHITCFFSLGSIYRRGVLE